VLSGARFRPPGGAGRISAHGDEIQARPGTRGGGALQALARSRESDALFAWFVPPWICRLPWCRRAARPPWRDRGALSGDQGRRDECGFSGALPAPARRKASAGPAEPICGGAHFVRHERKTNSLSGQVGREAGPRLAFASHGRGGTHRSGGDHFGRRPWGVGLGRSARAKKNCAPRKEMNSERRRSAF